MYSATLKRARVKRGGATANSWTLEAKSEVTVRTGSDPGWIHVRTDIPSKGGGTTDIELDIPRAEFQKLFTAMLKAAEGK